jgi:hypothetical protein
MEVTLIKTIACSLRHSSDWVEHEFNPAIDYLQYIVNQSTKSKAMEVYSAMALQMLIYFDTPIDITNGKFREGNYIYPLADRLGVRNVEFTLATPQPYRANDGTICRPDKKQTLFEECCIMDEIAMKLLATEGVAFRNCEIYIPSSVHGLLKCPYTIMVQKAKLFPDQIITYNSDHRRLSPCHSVAFDLYRREQVIAHREGDVLSPCHSVAFDLYRREQVIAHREGDVLKMVPVAIDDKRRYDIYRGDELIMKGGLWEHVQYQI